jgi:transcriptional regulator with XRE-family HTH domain
MRINVGTRIRAERTAKNLSQAGLEQRCGLQRCRISYLENGRAIPTLDTLEKIADALEIPVCQLLLESVESDNVGSRIGNAEMNGNGRRSRPSPVRTRNRFQRSLGRMSNEDQELLAFIAEKMVERHTIERRRRKKLTE